MSKYVIGWFTLLVLAIGIGGSTVGAPSAVAQDEQEAVEGAEQNDAAAPKPEGAGKNRMWWIIESSGFIGLFILCLSVYFVATVIRLFIELRPIVAMPSEEVAEVNQLLANRNYQGIYDFVSRAESLYSRLLTAGIAELPSGLSESREVMDRTCEVETVGMERKISILAVMGTLGPMIGLVGTLKGMIASFAVIALSDTQLKASEVAGGISEALLLTFEGVALSIPAIYFYSFFRNRVTVISAETLLAADELVRRIVQSSKRPAPTAAPVAARV